MASCLVAQTSRLHLAYEQHGDQGGPALLLLHGWPYDPRSYDPVVPRFARAGFRVIVPYCRGCGRTRFVDDGIPRSGEQAALGMDVVELLDALGVKQAILLGYDWGARAACVAAALRPDLVRALITCSGYSIHGARDPDTDIDVDTMYKGWYYWYLNTPMGEAGLPAVREQLAERLWRLWSPRTPFDPRRFALTAVSFRNPDWDAVTLSCYRTFFDNAHRDPNNGQAETFLKTLPSISVPTLILPGGSDGLYDADDALSNEHLFTGGHELRILRQGGHCPPTDAPHAFASTVLDFISRR